MPRAASSAAIDLAPNDRAEHARLILNILATCTRPRVASGRASTVDAAAKLMLVEIDKLRRSLGNAVILQSAHLALGEGEIYSPFGPNGAEEITTIATAHGLFALEAGTVRPGGHATGLGLHPNLVDFRAVHGRRPGQQRSAYAAAGRACGTSPVSWL